MFIEILLFAIVFAAITALVVCSFTDDSNFKPYDDEYDNTVDDDFNDYDE